MKRYIKATTQKPYLDDIKIEWEDIDNGIKVIISAPDNEVLFEEVFDYSDVDSDAIYDSALDMATAALSLKYELSDKVIETLNSGIDEL